MRIVHHSCLSYFVSFSQEVKISTVLFRHVHVLKNSRIHRQFMVNFLVLPRIVTFNMTPCIYLVQVYLDFLEGAHSYACVTYHNVRSKLFSPMISLSDDSAVEQKDQVLLTVTSSALTRGHILGVMPSYASVHGRLKVRSPPT